MVVAARVADAVIVDTAVDVVGVLLEVGRELGTGLGGYEDVGDVACFLSVRYLPLAYHFYLGSFVHWSAEDGGGGDLADAG